MFQYFSGFKCISYNSAMFNKIMHKITYSSYSITQLINCLWLSLISFVSIFLFYDINHLSQKLDYIKNKLV